MSGELVLIYISNRELILDLDQTILRPNGCQILQVNNLKRLETLLHKPLPAALIIREQVVDEKQGKQIDG
ncbi:MAG: hypothetical protein A2W36_00895 [Chloroflexi bacterium RBG_16_58_14]|nr:MAG: hypothetical protein A2W36_00895 [Chloroflexi bacterium RBG_16_58_14]